MSGHAAGSAGLTLSLPEKDAESSYAAWRERQPYDAGIEGGVGWTPFA